MDSSKRVDREISGHHLVYGTLTDVITGEQLPDTDDERFRQELARLLLEKKGYTSQELEPRLFIETLFNKNFVRSIIDLTVRVQGRRLFIIRYGPGSLVTREKPAIAAARVLDPDQQIPLAVVTNGRDAELLDTATGRVLRTGLQAAIPDRAEALRLVEHASFAPLDDPVEREKALRILNTFDLEICCRNAQCAVPHLSG